jgi:hypothetical protein
VLLFHEEKAVVFRYLVVWYLHCVTNDTHVPVPRNHQMRSDLIRSDLI